MKNIIVAFLFALHGFTFSQTMISNHFLGSDTLKIKMKYIDRAGCTSFSYGRVAMICTKKRFSFSHISTNEKRKSDHFWGDNKGIIDFLIKFEAKGKETLICEPSFGGATEIELFINDKKTKFSFCTKEWDGLQEFIDHITAMKTSEEKK